MDRFTFERVSQPRLTLCAIGWTVLKPFQMMSGPSGAAHTPFLRAGRGPGPAAPPAVCCVGVCFPGSEGEC